MQVASSSKVVNSLVNVILSVEGELYALISANCLWPIYRSNRIDSRCPPVCFLHEAVVLSPIQTAITLHSVPAKKVIINDMKLRVRECAINLRFLHRKNVECIRPQPFLYLHKFIRLTVDV